MAILPIELEPVEVLPDPSTNNRALVLYRGDLCYAYNNQWLRVVANRQAMGRFALTGYIFGGLSGTSSSAIRSFYMVTEAASQISTVLPYGRDSSSCLHTPVIAYIAGGSTGGSNVSQIASFRFYGESVGVISATLSVGKRNMARLRDTSKGYLSGGFSGSSLNVIDKLVYSTETYGPISAVLSSARPEVSGIRSSSHGYTCGGGTAVDKLSFSTETSAPTSSLQQSRNHSASGSIPTHGYIMAGSGRNTFEVWSFSTDTPSLKASVFSSGEARAGGVNSYTKGYILYTMASGRIEGILYSTDTVFQTTAQMVSNLSYNSQSSCQTGGIL